MWLKGDKSQINYLLFKNKIVANKIQTDIQHHISTATGCIPEGLQWHHSPERRIKKINNRNDKVSHQKKNVGKYSPDLRRKMLQQKKSCPRWSKMFHY